MVGLVLPVPPVLGMRLWLEIWVLGEAGLDDIGQLSTWVVVDLPQLQCLPVKQFLNLKLPSHSWRCERSWSAPGKRQLGSYPSPALVGLVLTWSL